MDKQNNKQNNNNKKPSQFQKSKQKVSAKSKSHPHAKSPAQSKSSVKPEDKRKRKSQAGGKSSAKVSSKKRNNGNKKADKTMNEISAQVHSQVKAKNQAKAKSNNRSKNRSSKGNAPASNGPMRIIPLGGMKEIGKNITLVEYNDQILIIDCGFSFPEDEMYGIDVVIPDFSYLRANSHKIQGLIITHGHEDHIGGTPYLLRELRVPVYGSALAIGLIKNKLKEHNVSANLNVINAGNVFKLGCFKIETIRTNHSVADAFAFSIKCPGGHVVHTGDFKIDYTPLDGNPIDLARFAQLGEEHVDVLLCDSTNVLRTGFTPSEKIITDSMNDIFDKTDKRIIIATFSSNIYRIKYFIEASIAHGRKIAVSGRSMENCIQLAKELGYINIPESAFVDIRKINQIPDQSLTIVTTGSQGEPMSALTRMSNDMHRAVKLKKGDVVIFSSSPIPGNEKTITGVVNKLYEKEVTVFLSDFVDIHVSGHACQEELKLIHTLIKPRYFVPAHGEYRHLVEHKKLAESIRMNKGNVFILSNGDSLVINGKNAKVERKYTTAEGILVDGYGVGDIGTVVLKDRKQLSDSGLIVVSVAINVYTKELAAAPELITRGFIYVKENGPLINEATEVVYQSIDKCTAKGATDLNTLKHAIKDDLRTFIYKKTKRSPMILPVIMYV